MERLPRHIEDLINKYKEGELSTEESYTLAQWLNLPGSHAVLEQYLSVPSTDSETHSDSVGHPFHDKTWLDILDKIQAEAAPSTVKQLTPDSPLGKRRGTVKYIGIAASLLILLFSVIAYLSNLFPNDPLATDEAPIWVTKSTKDGQKLNLTLADGSKIKLNNNSSISYKEQFLADSIRLVQLEGEGFFDVVEGKKPFVIESGEVTTRVMGTSFNIKKETEGNIQVAVVTGKVSVEKSEERVYLSPDQMAVVDANAIEKTSYNKDLVLGWKEGILQLSAGNFEELCKALEAWYGVNIQVEGKAPDNVQYKQAYDNIPVTEVLDGLSFMADFAYSVDGKKIKIIFN